MFYKHRGIEKLAEGKVPAAVLNIAESISGDESAANAAAFCIAIEKIGGATVPHRAWQLRRYCWSLRESIRTWVTWPE